MRLPNKAGLVAVVMLILLVTSMLTDVHAQKRGRRGSDMDKMDRRQKNLEKKVERTEELLNETRKTKKRSFNELQLLEKQINLRENLLTGLNYQITGIDGEIGRLELMIVSMEADMVRFRRSYAKVVYTSYKTQDDLSVLLWMFSAGNFLQAYDRMLYFKELSRYRRNQIGLIKRTQRYLQDKKNEKEMMKTEKSRLLGKRLTEKQKLDDSKDEKDRLYHDLRKSEKSYLSRLKNYKNELSQLKSEIKRLVLASRKELSTAKKDELRKLSDNFSTNKGRLPWPIPMNAGVITGDFGRNVTSNGIEMINDGIFISTKQGQPVRAVFNGVVSLITKVPSYGQVVILQHGNYRSVYANLEEVHVAKGDKVNVLQPLGTVKTNGQSGETQLYFQIYKEFNPVNPSAWITN